MNYGPEIWGPKAWNLLHSFSIIKTDSSLDKIKIAYTKFYHSFSAVLPCMECAEHYMDILLNKNPIEEDKITREYLLKWVFRTHNSVNKQIKKPMYKYSDFLKDILENPSYIRHDSIFFILRATFFGTVDYKNLTMYKYRQLHTFFTYFCKLYPEKSRRGLLRNLLKNKNMSFKKYVKTPITLQTWMNENISTLKSILLGPS